ncbi:MAG TPA: tetratricopeptide repeat protein, partial [Phycisphaerae bacterium]|nr:tetratricopeptide repeat protein [Phycisphaerae bacterium]
PGWKSARTFLAEVLHPSTVEEYYQPLAMISLMADYALGGRPENPRIFHATSLALHGVNVFLVVMLMWLLFENWAAAGLAGLLFGLHPMNVESIPWLAERKTVLAAMFGLAAMTFYVRSAKAAGRNGATWYGMCIGAFVLALLSKPTVMPLPICLLVMDAWPLRRFGRRAVLEKIPLLLLAGASAVITVLSQKNTAGITRPPAFPPGAIPLIVSHNVVFYLRKLVWPWPLSGFYAFPHDFSLREPAYLIGVIGTAGLVVLLYATRKKAAAWLAGLGFFLVAILPTLGIVGSTAVIAADRFVYFPMVGLVMALAGLMAGRINRRMAASTILAAGIVCAIYAVGVRQYLTHWTDTEAFMRYMLEGAPDSASLRLRLGDALEKKGRGAEAIAEFEKAVQADPQLQSGYVQLGRALLKAGQIEPAHRALSEAIRLQPDSAEARLYLGDCFAAEGELDKAEEQFRESIRLRPGDYRRYYKYGTFLEKAGRSDEAIGEFSRALRLRPDNGLTLYEMGLTYLQLGRVQDALMRLSEALAARPDMAQIRYQLACANMLQKRVDVAMDFWRKAIQLEPHYVAAMTDLAWLLSTCEEDRYRRPVEGLRWATQACELTENREPMALDTLAAALAARGRFAEAVEKEQKSIELAGDPSKLKLGARSTTIEKMKQRLALYKAGKAYLEPLSPKDYQPARPGATTRKS